jgi:(5-formylfuran-3-yl)methyl phosphate synthase
VAGSLALDDVGAVARIGPDVLGVRGAACLGGRSGKISIRRVRELRQRLGSGPSGETRDHRPELAT